jgi:hypothetical protein
MNILFNYSLGGLNVADAFGTKPSCTIGLTISNFNFAFGLPYN